MQLIKMGCLVSLLVGFIPVAAQQLLFDAYLGKDHIGTMIVSRYEKDGTIHYASVTDLTLTYVISIDLDLTYAASYKNSQLLSSSFNYKRNQKMRESCYGEAKGNTYYTYFEDRTEKVAAAMIDQSLLAAFFQEPVNKTSVFSERWGLNIPISKMGNKKYKLVLPDGKESHMTYAGGECRESRIVSGWGDIVFRRP